MDGKAKKKNLHAMPKAIGFVAVIWIIGTFIWFVFSKHWDPNIFLIYLVVGVGGISLSKICEWIIRVKIDSKKDIKEVKDELVELDKTVSSLSTWIKTKVDKLEGKKEVNIK